MCRYFRMLPYMFAGTPLNEEDSDAFQMLLQDAKIKLPPSQLTFEKAQQLLREKGHKDLATNLRARLEEGNTISTVNQPLYNILCKCIIL